jgi:hypothetical protein
MSKVIKREARKHPLIVIMIVFALAAIAAIAVTAVAYADEGATPTDQATTEQTTVDTESAPPAEVPTTEVVAEDTVPSEQPTETTETTKASNLLAGQSLGMTVAGYHPPSSSTSTTQPPKGALTIQLTLVNPSTAVVTDFGVKVLGLNGNQPLAFGAGGMATFSNVDLGTYSVKSISGPVGDGVITYPSGNSATLDSGHLARTIDVVITWPKPVQGTLTVTLTFVNAPAGMDDPTDYTASVKDNGSQPFNASGNAVFGNLDLGQNGEWYEVTGVSPLNGATPNYGAKVKLDKNNPNKTIAVTFTWPKPQLYDLCLHKIFAAGFPQKWQDHELWFAQAVCAGTGYDSGKIGLDGNGDFCFRGLRAGNYTWTEFGPNGVVFTGVCSLGNPIAIGGGLTVACVPEDPKPIVVRGTIVNTYVPPVYKVIVDKQVIGGSLGAASFAANCSGVSGSQNFVAGADPTKGQTEFVVSGPGLRTVSESAVDHYTASYPDGPTVTLTEDNPVQTIHIVNTYVPPATTTTVPQTTTTLHKGDRDDMPFTGTQIGIFAGVMATILLIGGALWYKSRRKVDGVQQ